MKTSQDYRRYEAAARGVAAAAETDSEREYFAARADLHDTRAQLQELAEQRVASGASSTIESAIWSITYTSGYCHGRSDGQDGTSRDITGASEGYAAGYGRGYKWGTDHQPVNGLYPDHGYA